MTRTPKAATETDEALCVRLRSGDTAAGELLIERYLPMVQRRAGALREKGIDSEDLAQEGMLGLLGAIRFYDVGREASFSTYAYRCITNRMLSSIAAAGRSLPSVPLDNEEDAKCMLPDAAEDPQEILISREQTERLWTVYGQMSELEQKALRLYLGGYRYQEMAASLQCTTKAVDNALQRARRKLRVR